MNFNFNGHIIAATQIIAESAPVSSSGHVTLINQWLGYPLPPEWYLDLTHIITLALLGIIFWSSWFFIAKRIILTLINGNYQRKSYKLFWHILRPYLYSVFVIDCISSAFYFGIKLSRCIPDNNFILATGFFITMLALISTTAIPTKSPQINSITIMALGISQGLAILPGISRMGITYATTRWCGFSGKQGLNLSLAIQVPLILGELTLVFLKHNEISWNYFPQTTHDILFYLATVLMSGIVLFLVKKMAEKNTLWLWSFYLVIPCLITLFID